MDISMSPRLCFVGLYEGEAKVGANYGIEWEWGIFPHPYFNMFANGDKICETEFYCWAPDAEGLEIKLGPWIKVTPSLGIDWSAVSVRASVPVTATAKIENNAEALLPSFF